jgi:hypothetical protein
MSISTLSPNFRSAVLALARTMAIALARRLLAPVLIAGVLAGGYELHLALESPGEVIRHDLTRAAARVASLPSLMPRERVQQTLSRYFPRYHATIDASGFPADVAVTLLDLDVDTCRDAYRRAARIEGDVVIAIEERRGGACHDRTAITWHIMP